MLILTINTSNKFACTKRTANYNILSIGMNKYADVDGTLPSIHAEHDAILRLPCLQNKNKRRKVKINLLVIRFLKTYTLANSKPCFNCIQNMIKKKNTILS